MSSFDWIGLLGMFAVVGTIALYRSYRKPVFLVSGAVIAFTTLWLLALVAIERLTHQ